MARLLASGSEMLLQKRSLVKDCSRNCRETSGKLTRISLEFHRFSVKSFPSSVAIYLSLTQSFNYTCRLPHSSTLYTREQFESQLGSLSLAKSQMATTTTTEEEEEEMGVGEFVNSVMVMGIDDNEHSYYALQWTLHHFFSTINRGPNPPFKLVIVHAKPTRTSVVGLAGPGAADVLPFVESDLRKIAGGVIEKARQLCAAGSVRDIVFEVVEGDAKNVLCEAVKKYHADMLVVGSHGYGAIQRAVMGSVSDYCAHEAHCTVMIVKKPKSKH